MIAVLYAAVHFARELFRQFTGQLGATGERNVQGEDTKKLDVFGNQTIIEAFARNERWVRRGER